jgi:hypothetical protein
MFNQQLNYGVGMLVSLIYFIGSHRAAKGPQYRQHEHIKGLPVTVLFNDMGEHTSRIRGVHSQVPLQCQHTLRASLGLARSR